MGPNPAIPRLAELFDPRRNNLDFLRLVLALGVVVSHAWPLGKFADFDPYARANHQITIGTTAVHSFFFLSGFLITRSARSSSSLGRFLWHRCLRIFPAYWVCLIVTAFCFTPLLHWLTKAPGDPLFRHTTTSAFGYAWRNLSLIPYQPVIGGWWEPNGSLWTLWPEFQCYLFVGTLALLGVLRHRAIVGGLLGFLVLFHAVHIFVPTALYNTGMPLMGDLVNYSLVLYFMMGSACELYADRVVVSGRLALAAAALVAFTLHQGSYYLFAPVVLPYVLIWLVLKLPCKGWGRLGDYSYGVYIYGYPIEVLLERTGCGKLGLPCYLALAITLTLACAFLSYHLIEKHALRMKSLSFRVSRSQEAGRFGNWRVHLASAPKRSHVGTARTSVGSAASS